MIDKTSENKQSNETDVSIKKVDAIDNKSNLTKKDKKIIVNKKTNREEIFNEIFNELILKKSNLLKEINLLEKQRDNLIADIGSNFSGQSDNIAKRVKGFQDYLTGALLHLSQTVEKLELVSQPIVVKPSPLDENQIKANNEIINVPALSDTFKPDEKIIRKCFSLFCKQPDFYADPWKLRRSLDEEDIEMLDDWFFNMGGRGAFESRGSRQKNALLSAGLISILGELYGDQFQTLILASEPERLGEWRRVLQDSLGLTRDDFGPNSGIVLFERPEGVIEKADRLEAENEVPLIIIDGSETNIEIPILQFPLWLAFVGSEDEIYNDFEMN